MPNTLDSSNQTTESPHGSGCAVFLIDESRSMEARVPEGTKSKAESVATAVNGLLSALTGGPDLDVAIVGYRSESDGRPDIGCRWGGPLSEAQFVATSRLAQAPLAVEDRIRKIPGPGGMGVAREETVRFPIWYAAKLGGLVSRAAALDYCGGLLSAWLATASPVKAPLLVHLFGELGGLDACLPAVEKVWQCETPAGRPLVFHAHVGSLARIPPTLYPSTDAHLAPGPIRDLFGMSSILPEPLAAALRQSQMTVNPGARGLVCNAKVVDLIRFLSLVRTYAQYQPPVAAAAPTPEPATAVLAAETTQAVTPAVETSPAPVQAADQSTTLSLAASPTVSLALPRTESAAAGDTSVLVVLVLDRSLENPSGGDEKRVWRRLQENANELLGQIGKRANGAVWCAVASYGTNAAGQPEIQTTFAGPLAGRNLVRDTELAAGALRVDEVTEQVSNGIGGLISIARKKAVFVEIEPAAALSPVPAFAAVNEILLQWRQEHQGSRPSPVLLHLTRGRFEPAEIEEAVALVRQCDLGLPSPVLYHLVLTEQPHRSLAYPAEPAGIEGADLQKLWELSSPLLGTEKLCARRPTISAQSRGIVINGKFDLLLDGIDSMLESRTQG